MWRNQGQQQDDDREAPLLTSEGVVAVAAPSTSFFASCCPSNPNPLLATSSGGRGSRRLIFIGVPCFLLLTTLLALLGYFVNNGAFSKVSRDVRIVNGTVTEPNTRMVFPVNRPTVGADGKVERLIGLLLKTRHIPQLEATLHIFALAIYVDRADARRELVRFKDGVPHPHQDSKQFQQFLNVISTEKITFTFEYRMVMSPPGTHMHDGWLQDLVSLWQQYQLPQERIATLKRCFSDWFLNRGFHNKDDIFIEISSRTKQTRAQVNGVPLKSVCTDPMFGRAIITHEFVENGVLAGDLLPTLWNTEYDDM
jgi:hypothetical protein